MESAAKKTEDADKQVSKKSASAEQKRIQSIIEMKKTYQKQKNTIKAALSRVDTSSNRKIIFDDEADNTHISENASKKALFSDEEADEDDTEYNFTVKEYLTGKKGKKLMELQSKFKNDKRFTMNEQFLDDGEEDEENAMEIDESKQNGDKHNETMAEDDDVDIAKEKQKEMSILENILGEKVKKRDTDTDNNNLFIQYYDPSYTEMINDKYFIKENKSTEKKKKRKNDNEENEVIKKPHVSKETFYEVKENLKDTLENNQSFSFLSMFNSHPEAEKETNESNEIINHNTTNVKQKNRNHNLNQENPFRYDSSEESDNDQEPENKEGSGNQVKDQNNENKSSTARLWTESFFFKEDDYRFQEGLDFVKKFELDDRSEFKEVRRNIRQIVRDKVRHNQRKNRPFKKKLGGKRMIKIKKALKNK